VSQKPQLKEQTSFSETSKKAPTNHSNSNAAANNNNTTTSSSNQSSDNLPLQQQQQSTQQFQAGSGNAASSVPAQTGATSSGQVMPPVSGVPGQGPYQTGVYVPQVEYALGYPPHPTMVIFQQNRLRFVKHCEVGMYHFIMLKSFFYVKI